MDEHQEGAGWHLVKISLAARKFDKDTSKAMFLTEN
jgi:hypothetical protein